MQTCHETKKIRGDIKSVVSDITCLVRNYPNTELWWFGSSVKCEQREVGDIDLAVISSSKKELSLLKQKLRQDYPNSHFDHAPIYTKSTNNDKSHTCLPLHFVFREHHEVFASHRLEHEIQMGIQLKERQAHG